MALWIGRTGQFKDDNSSIIFSSLHLAIREEPRERGLSLES